jgi:hypothetical protein
MVWQEARTRSKLHVAAKQAIADRVRSGVPLIIYLRKFSTTVLHGETSDAPGHLAENQILAGLERGINFVTVQAHLLDSYAEHTGSQDSILRRRAPALNLKDSKWLSEVQQLIAWADLIFAEYQMPSTKGVRAELEYSLHIGANERTVLIAPSGGIFSFIDNDRLIQRYYRCFYYSQFTTENLRTSFVVQDLMDRLRLMARLSPGEQEKLTDPRARLERFPITYDGVAEGYINLADDPNIMSRSEVDEDLWQYRFWSYFRAAAVINRLLLTQKLAFDQGAPNLIYCYLRMGELSLRGEWRGEQLVVRGDLEFARQCVNSAAALIQRSGATRFERAWQALRTDIENWEKVIRTHHAIFDLIIGPIVGASMPVQDFR